jgi:hypothetical protein
MTLVDNLDVLWFLIGVALGAAGMWLLAMTYLIDRTSRR